MVYLRQAALSFQAGVSVRGRSKCRRYSDRASKKERHYSRARPHSSRATRQGNRRAQRHNQDHPNEKKRLQGARGHLQNRKRDAQKSIENYRKAIDIISTSSHTTCWRRVPESAKSTTTSGRSISTWPYGPMRQTRTTRGPISTPSAESLTRRSSRIKSAQTETGFLSVRHQARIHAPLQAEYEEALSCPDNFSWHRPRYAEPRRGLRNRHPAFTKENSTRPASREHGHRRRSDGWIPRQIEFLEEYYIVTILYEKGDVKGALGRAEKVGAAFRKAKPG